VKGEYYSDRGCCLPTDLALNPYPYELNFNPFGTSDKSEASTTVHANHAKVYYAPATPKYCINNQYVSHLPVKDRMITGYAATGTGQYTISGEVTMPSGVDVWIHEVLVGAPTYGNRNISKFIRERYVGANSPLLAFDDKGERFNFQQLHTPLYVGNEANAGDGITSIAETGGTAVVEINRRLLGNDFTPEMMPYGTPIQPTKAAAADDKTPPIQPMNLNLIPWQLYDSDGGIFLENFGLSEAQWPLSLWGVLGFSYGQFNTEVNNRQTRINNIVEGSAGGSVTTNANLEASDVVKFRGNRYGTSLYTNQPPIASVLGNYANAVAQSDVDYPVISIDQTSAQVSAQNLPRKMLRPYFLVKSNIVGDMNYYGGSDSGQSLPIVCVINKENGFGDFYFQRGFDLEFTATIPRVITSVTTSIHDPDMRLSNVSGDSAVIFKITKQNSANLDVIQDVMQLNQGVLLRHSEALRIAQEEGIRQAVRNRSPAAVGEMEHAGAPIGGLIGQLIPTNVSVAGSTQGSSSGIGGSSLPTPIPLMVGGGGSSGPGSSDPVTSVDEPATPIGQSPPEHHGGAPERPFPRSRLFQRALAGEDPEEQRRRVRERQRERQRREDDPRQGARRGGDKPEEKKDPKPE
jgi:hypothetical protein